MVGHIFAVGGLTKSGPSPKLPSAPVKFIIIFFFIFRRLVEHGGGVRPDHRPLGPGRADEHAPQSGGRVRDEGKVVRHRRLQRRRETVDRRGFRSGAQNLEQGCTDALQKKVQKGKM